MGNRGKHLNLTFIVLLLISAVFCACGESVTDISAEAKTYEHDFETSRTGSAKNDSGKEKIEDRAGLSTSGDAPLEQHCFAKVIATTLNIRSGPSTDTTVLGQVRMGAEFEVISVGSEWVKVIYNGTEAYVYAPYVQITGDYTDMEDENFAVSVYDRDYSYSNLDIVSVEDGYSYSRLCDDIEKLTERYGSKIYANPIATTADNRFIYELSIGKNSASGTVMIYAGMNGSESLTSLILMKQAEHYLSKYSEYTDLFDKVCLKIYPMINPDGVTLAVSGETGINTQELRDAARSRYSRDITLKKTTLGKPDYFAQWDANLKGVDIYYNFGHNWDLFEGSIIPGASKYKGEFSLSEAESNAVLKQLKKEDPDVVIGYFEGERGIVWNFGQTGNIFDACTDMAGILQNVTHYESKTPEDPSCGFDAYVIGDRETPSFRIDISGGSGELKINDFDDVWKDIRDIWETFDKMPLKWDAK